MQKIEILTKIKPIQNVLIGSDPEYIVRDLGTNEPKSVVGKLGGSKYDPIYIDKHMSYQEDNVNVEFTVTPTTDPKEMLREIHFLKDYCNNLLSKKGLVIDMDTVSAEYSDEELNSDVAKTFGCSSSDDCWVLLTRESPDNTLNIRCAGGHFHISYDNPDYQTSMMLARAFDLYLGIPSLLLDKDTNRRKLYGLAGDVRLTGYGFEYRTLSNHITQEQEYLEYYFFQIFNAIEAVNNGLRLNDLEQANQICNAINTYNTQQAQYLMEQNKIISFKEFMENYSIYTEKQITV